MNDELFRDGQLASRLLGRIRAVAAGLPVVKIMEVCGTHTMEIGRQGLRSLLPANIELLSGPGCPVCVTPGSVIDAAAQLAARPHTTVMTFGDMIRVPGTTTSLQAAKAAGASVIVATSPLQILEFASKDSSCQYVFVAVGFETTIPSVAAAVSQVKARGISNASFLVSLRVVPEALDALVADASIGLSGFLLPGHVSAIIGEAPYQRLVKAGLPAAITGFEPLDILSGLLHVLEMIASGIPAVVNAYTRVVHKDGNPQARAMIDAVFEPCDALWRGIGVIPGAGLRLRAEFASLDAEKRFGVTASGGAETMPAGCSCGEVLRGRMPPDKCPLFGTVCTPDNPVGPCMVSSEGSCAAYHRYGGLR